MTERPDNRDAVEAPIEASTETVAAADRLEYWENWNQSSLVGLRCSSPTPERFTARSSQLRFPDGVLTRIQGSQHIVDRNERNIQEIPKDSIFVNVLLRGQAFLMDSSGMRLLRAGDSFVHTTMTPYLLGFDRDMDLLIVDVNPERAPEHWRNGADTSPRIHAPSLASRALAQEGLAALIRRGDGVRLDGAQPLPYLGRV
ncbi:AraC family transcriptional regulator [Micrococcus luteus]|uniref:hypothetical protein n=1 Tax=Micrococcus luteus TaxID=1270 RepID=UPI00044CF95A|nr:hypothetical protein [Micrococcus luteus]EZP42997.1 AraC family transcriptional regulator [Micrococcus luteus]